MSTKRNFLYGGYTFEQEQGLKAARETARKKEGRRQGRNKLRKRKY